MLRALELIDFKSFERARLVVGSFTVIVGSNASGKSNIRDAFRFFHGVGRGYSLADIIGGKYGAGGQSQWSQLRGAVNEIVRFGEETFALSANLYINRRSYRYFIEVERNERFRTGFRLKHERLSRNGLDIFTSYPDGPDATSMQQDDNRLDVRLSKVGGQRRFGKRLSVRRDQPALTQIADFSESAKVQRDACEELVDFFASFRFLDLVPEAMRKPSFPGQTVLGDSGENLSTVLQDICSDPIRKAVLMEWVSELTPMDVTDFRFPVDSTSGHVQLAIEDSRGNAVSAYSASDGTLRFLAMLAALLGSNPAKLYFFEEIDNGIHPSRLRLLLDLIETQTGKSPIQVVTTTHSPELLSMINDQTFAATSVVYRNDHESSAQIQQLSAISGLAERRRDEGLGALHAMGWIEDSLSFAERDDE